jgi:hypothetical protein
MGEEAHGDQAEKRRDGQEGSWSWRMQDFGRQADSLGADLQGLDACRNVATKIPEQRRKDIPWDFEGERLALHLLVVAFADFLTERVDEALVGFERAVDERRVNPQEEIRIHRGVAPFVPLPLDPSVDGTDPCRRSTGLRAITEGHRQRRVECAPQARVGIAGEAAVIDDPGSDGRMRDLHEECPTAPEQQGRLGVDPPGHRPRRKHPWIAGPAQRKISGKTIEDLAKARSRSHQPILGLSRPKSPRRVDAEFIRVPHCP